MVATTNLCMYVHMRAFGEISNPIMPTVTIMLLHVCDPQTCHMIPCGCIFTFYCIHMYTNYPLIVHKGQRLYSVRKFVHNFIE